ncbi:hypothetical protein JOE21_000460 [Desmospora profundinema]|uniref:Uncharacterized protein n=1 Tax=Desmospora profundinema TaxID=1571184 RepID=A0ABU1II72_9BACL|nr:hypothetical protein [Desmospora profundinema]
MAGGEPLRFLQRNEDSHTDLGSRYGMFRHALESIETIGEEASSNG